MTCASSQEEKQARYGAVLTVGEDRKGRKKPTPPCLARKEEKEKARWGIGAAWGEQMKGATLAMLGRAIQEVLLGEVSWWNVRWRDAQLTHLRGGPHDGAGTGHVCVPRAYCYPCHFLLPGFHSEWRDREVSSLASPQHGGQTDILPPPPSSLRG